MHYTDKLSDTRTQGAVIASDTEKELARRGLELQRMREDAGIEQADAAQRVGISRVTLSRYENGRQRPPHDVIERLYVMYGRHTGVASAPRRTSGVAEDAPPYHVSLVVPHEISAMLETFERELIRGGASDIEADFVRATLNASATIRLVSFSRDSEPVTLPDMRKRYLEVMEALRILVTYRVQQRTIAPVAHLPVARTRGPIKPSDMPRLMAEAAAARAAELARDEKAAAK